MTNGAASSSSHRSFATSVDTNATEIEIPSVHLSPEDAGLVANHAGVARLVLTHLGQGLEDEEAIERAASTFNGAIEVAKPGTMIEA